METLSIGQFVQSLQDKLNKIKRQNSIWIEDKDKNLRCISDIIIDEHGDMIIKENQV